jgi:hypothetical protein
MITYYMKNSAYVVVNTDVSSQGSESIIIKNGIATTIASTTITSGYCNDNGGYGCGDVLAVPSPSGKYIAVYKVAKSTTSPTTKPTSMTLEIRTSCDNKLVGSVQTVSNWKLQNVAKYVPHNIIKWVSDTAFVTTEMFDNYSADLSTLTAILYPIVDQTSLDLNHWYYYHPSTWSW